MNSSVSRLIDLAIIDLEYARADLRCAKIPVSALERICGHLEVITEALAVIVETEDDAEFEPEKIGFA